jgi:hypothetical protein
MANAKLPVSIGVVNQMPVTVEHVGGLFPPRFMETRRKSACPHFGARRKLHVGVLFKFAAISKSALAYCECLGALLPPKVPLVLCTQQVI